MTLLWRSLQYVPAHVEKYAASSRILEADAVILDLQDSVPAHAKDDARAAAAGIAPGLAAKGPDVLVRINEGARGEDDAAAVVGPGVRALVVPQVRSPSEIHQLDRRLEDIEASKGLTPGVTGLLVLIESAVGLTRMSEIAGASRRILAINLGNEDLARDLGVEPDEDALSLPRRLMIIAAASANVQPLGLVGSGADFSDLDAYRALAERSRRIGARGASCIHPSQITVLNQVFSPSEAERAWAERVLAAAETADADRGAFALDGQMIDAPILARAADVLARCQAIEDRSRRSAAPAD